MRHIVATFAVAAAVAAVASSATAQQNQTPLRVAASSFASVEVHINSRKIGNSWYEEDASLSGPSRIAITYGQPHARGRRIEGGLIPRDTVWRFGANLATALHSDVDMEIGGLVIPRGDYSLYLLNTPTEWWLIVNRNTAQWGSDRDPNRDMGRVKLVARTMAESEETLTIYLVPESARPSTGYAELRGTLRIKWGRTELTSPWRVPQ